MNYNILYALVLLFSTGYSTNLVGCRKIGEINNNINNQELYSTGFYMCLELPNQNLLNDEIINKLVFSETNNLKSTSNLSTSTNTNSNFLTNSTNNINTSYISEEVEKNITNNISILSPSVFINVKSPSPKSPSPKSPSSVLPSPVISSPSPKSSLSVKSIIQIPEVNISPSTVNLTSKNNTQDSIDLEINPLLPTIITLSSILVIVSCILLVRYIYNKREHKVFTSKNIDTQQKTENNSTLDIETGENIINPPISIRKNNIKSNIGPMKKFKPRGKITRNNTIEKKTRPKPPHINQANKSLEKNQKKRVREILLERSKKLPGGENNKNIKKLLTRLSVNGSKNSIEKLDHIDIINNAPNNPPPPLPPQEDITIKSQESQDIYHNPNNNLSPKMLVNEINR